MRTRRTRKTVRVRCTLKSNQQAVRLITEGQSVAAVAKTLGMMSQTLFNQVNAERRGKLKGVDTKVVSAEQTEISRQRAKLARMKTECDILEKATALRQVQNWPGFANAQS